MIIVKLMAGLGNQMFQYATAKRLAVANNTELKLDISSYENMHAKDTPRQYELDCFNISATVATKKEMSRVKQGNYKRNFGERVTHKLGIGSVVHVYGERDLAFDDRILRLKDNTYLIGWWQNEKYFKDIRDILQKEFIPVTKPSGNNAVWLKQAQSSESVSIHVRRGDYVSNKYASVHHGLPSIDYYNAAALYLNTYLKNPHFFVFSDDIEWCKKNFKFGKKITFVEGNTGSKAYEDLRIMSACKHNVIANSSFSWWGAWLNNNKDKVVIAPIIWFQDKEANRKTNIIPSEWMRM